MKFTASRLSDGNKILPDQISIDENSVTIRSPKLFGGSSKSFPLGQITVSINTPFIGYSDITLSSHGTRMRVHGFSSSDANEIRKILENGVKDKEKVKKDIIPEPVEKVDKPSIRHDICKEDKAKQKEKKIETIKNYSDGIYEGGWKNEERKGQGIMSYNNGDIYLGKWKHNLKTGTGKFIFANGDVYDGEWVKDQKEGSGKMTFSDGSLYKGAWFQERMDGSGIMTYFNGDVYDGEWMGGEKEGAGTMKYANGNIYEGEWRADSMGGIGTMKHANGNVYVGMWYGGERKGAGKMVYDNGNVYDGEWLLGYRHGLGTMDYEGGKVYTGEWTYNEQGTKWFKDCLYDRDSLFQEAAFVIVTCQQSSSSLLQRKFDIGYQRAGRIIEQLEVAGIVSGREVIFEDQSSLKRHFGILDLV